MRIEHTFELWSPHQHKISNITKTSGWGGGVTWGGGGG